MKQSNGMSNFCFVCLLEKQNANKMIEILRKKNGQKLMKTQSNNEIARKIGITAGAFRLKWKWIPAREKTLYVNNRRYKKKTIFFLATSKLHWKSIVEKKN